MSETKPTEVKYRYMRKWYEFLRTLETSGATTLILILLMLLFVGLHVFGVAESLKFLDTIIGALLLLLKTQSSAHSYIDSPEEKPKEKIESENIDNDKNTTNPQVL